MQLSQWLMKTKAGSVYLVASDLGLRGVYWNKQTVPFATSLKVDCPAVQILAQSVGQLDEYFAGKRMEFDLPLDVQGTEFQKSVWKALTKIPYGKTASYRDIAKKVKNENASRAVGTANGKNPLCIIVPCHRVIASNGTLGGYSGGLHLKTQLLALEKSLA
ncbi:MAG: methylated-DNA--[protein]-cysteine S-methyltransferase [Bdellovibrionales bacterium]|nr:methylated-DNA--[protein]-cysteine S-methyltransferase [Oligoflexia bacterium]